MRIPAAAAVAPCRSPTGAKGVNELQEDDLDCRSADAGKPGPCTRLYLTPTHSHRGSCPASPGEPGSGCDSRDRGGLQRAGQVSAHMIIAFGVQEHREGGGLDSVHIGGYGCDSGRFTGDDLWSLTWDYR